MSALDGLAIVSVPCAERASTPLDALGINVIVPSGAAAVVLMLNVADCADASVRLITDGVIVALTPAGKTPRLKLTWPVKPPNGVTSKL